MRSSFEYFWALSSLIDLFAVVTKSAVDVTGLGLAGALALVSAVADVKGIFDLLAQNNTKQSIMAPKNVHLITFGIMIQVNSFYL